ncbi:MAG: hypothetical protein HKN47_09260 [Pirellulaceae bacterium]|nr:hypothetical protein [Pirellulaceae bacterium]
MKCPAPFFLWFHHRSGSSHLSSLLDSHDQIASWGEFFYRGEAGAAGDLFTRSGSDSEAAFLEHLYCYRWADTGANLCETDPVPPLVRAVGFKLKYQQADTHPGALNYLRRQPGMKAIHLIRTNLLSALVSAAMIPRLIKKFRRPNLIHGESPRQVETSVRLNPQTIVCQLEELEHRIDVARGALVGLDLLEITYEDLLDQQSATCRTVLDFLGVDASVELTSRFVKIMPRSLDSSLANKDEIAAALRGSRFASLLDAG